MNRNRPIQVFFPLSNMSLWPIQVLVKTECVMSFHSQWHHPYGIHFPFMLLTLGCMYCRPMNLNPVVVVRVLQSFLQLVEHPPHPPFSNKEVLSEK